MSVIIQVGTRAGWWEHITHRFVISLQICKSMQECSHKHTHFAFQFKVLFFIQLSY